MPESGPTACSIRQLFQGCQKCRPHPHNLTSIEFLLLSADLLAGATFLSFATLLLLLPFLLVHRGRFWLFLGRCDAFRPGPGLQAAYWQGFGLVVLGQQDQFAADHTRHSARRQLAHGSLSPSMSDMSRWQAGARLAVLHLRLLLGFGLTAQAHAPQLRQRHG